MHIIMYTLALLKDMPISHATYNNVYIGIAKRYANQSRYISTINIENKYLGLCYVRIALHKIHTYYQ